MIKIEFKEALQGWNYSLVMPNEFKYMFFNWPYRCLVRVKDNPYVNKVSFGCPSELVPSRSEVLKQLGVSRQKDQANQKKWNIIANAT